MSEPLDRESIKSAVARYTCAKNCYGSLHNAAGCCKISDRDYIIGPMTDCEEFVQRLNERDGTSRTVDDVFIGFKEGSKLFPQKRAWQKPDNYPAMRVDMENPSLQCRFLTENDECGVYDIRPLTCQRYRCEHLRKVLDLL